jgi:hypothetical protein
MLGTGDQPFQLGPERRRSRMVRSISVERPRSSSST